MAFALLMVNSADLKMLRESLCREATAPASAAKAERLGLVIAEIDLHRPLGPDGKHGNLHTPTCGCSG